MTKETHVFHDTRVTCWHVNQCSYSAWSSHFPHNTPPAKILKNIPPAFLDYLNSDSIRLPPSTNAVEVTSDNDYSDWEDDATESDPCAAFADFDAEIADTVKLFGSVLPKLNWSAPKDARWILINNSLQCTSPADIYLLLNASDHVAHDLDGHIYDECEPRDESQFLAPELVIKKWISDFNPALQFRVFVRGGKIVGACQRDMNHYQFLSDMRLQLHTLIVEFHKNVIKPSNFPLKDFIADIYIPRRDGPVLIMDINPFTRKWDSLLFTWHELLEKENDGEFELRVITETNMGALSRKEHSENQVPIEVVDALVNADAMIELAREWRRTEPET